MDVFLFLSYLTFPVYIIGLAGNAVSFLIFSRTAFQKNSIGFYCRALSAFNFFLLFAELIDSIGTPIWGVNFAIKYTVACKLFYFIYIGLSPISAWIMVAFSIDKAFCVIFPNRFDFIRKKKFQLVVIGAIILGHPIAYSYVPVAINLSANYVPIEGTNLTVPIYECSVRTAEGRLLILLYVIQAILLPFGIMLGSSLVTIRELLISRSRLEALQESQKLKGRRAKDRKFAINSIVLNVLYVVFVTPICVGFLAPFSNFWIYLTYFGTGVFLWTVNFAMPFFAHLASNSLFRKELQGMFRSSSERQSSIERF